MEVDRLRAASSGLGCGAVVAIGSGECPVAVAASVMGFFARESSGQCGVCVKGTAAMRDAVASLASGKGDPAAVEGLGRWSTGLPGRGACALLDGAAMLAGSLLREFPELVAHHLVAGCALCRRRRQQEWAPASALAG
jgi:NADH:ubiquinone oxidoreductase subunit F (NADH-binding)